MSNTKNKTAMTFQFLHESIVDGENQFASNLFLNKLINLFNRLAIHLMKADEVQGFESKVVM